MLLDFGHREDDPPLPDTGRSEQPLLFDSCWQDDLSLQDFEFSLNVDDLLVDQDVPQPFVEEPQPFVEEAHASVLPGAEEQQDLVQPVVDEQTLTDDQF